MLLGWLMLLAAGSATAKVLLTTDQALKLALSFDRAPTLL